MNDIQSKNEVKIRTWIDVGFSLEVIELCIRESVMIRETCMKKDEIFAAAQNSNLNNLIP